MTADNFFNTTYSFGRVIGDPVVRQGKNGKEYTTVMVELPGQKRSAFCQGGIPPAKGSTVIVRIVSRERGFSFTVLPLVKRTQTFLEELYSCSLHQNPDIVEE